MPKAKKSKYTQKLLVNYFHPNDISRDVLLSINNQLKEVPTSDENITTNSNTPELTEDVQLPSVTLSDSNGEPEQEDNLLTSIGTQQASNSHELNENIQLNSTIEPESHINNYKKKCVTMSCIISKKTIKLNELEKENASLKIALETNISSTEESSGLSTDDLTDLFSLPKEPSSDMTFVRKAILKLYRGDVHRLQHKVLKGVKPRVYKNKKGEIIEKVQREPMTPVKVKALKALYDKRVKLCEPRVAMFNRHVTNSLLKIRERLQNASRNQISSMDDEI